MIIKYDYPTPAPDGDHNAVYIDVVDLGLVDSVKYGKKHKLRLVWEIDAKRDDGSPYQVRQTYGASIGPKSNLRKHLKSWRGRDFTPEELRQFDLENIIGAPCRLVVVHNEAADGRIFANVETILKPNGVKLAPSGKYVRVKDRTEDQKSSSGFPGAPELEPEMENQDIPF